MRRLFVSVHKSFYLIVVAVLLLSISSDLSAQSNIRIKGSVTADDDGSPVRNATIRIDGTAFETTTSGDGHFSISDIPEGVYQLMVTAPGFDPYPSVEVEVVADISRTVHIRLRRKIYPLEGIRIRGHRQPVTREMTVIDRRQIERTQAAELSEVLEAVPGVEIHRTGPGGQAAISIRGSTPDQVLVLIDGRRLNSASGGAADLNSIPIDVVERIELYKSGASAKFGPNAMAGAVNIVTRAASITSPRSIETGFSRGTWKTYRSNFSFESNIPGTGISHSINYERKSTAGDFSYTYHVSPGDAVYEGTRINNAFESQALFGRGYLSKGSFKADLSVQYYDAANGLPGKVSQQNEDASREDKRIQGNSGIEYRFAEYLTARLSAACSENIQYFSDRSGPVLNQYETRYTERGVDIKGELVTNLLPNHQITLGGQYQKNKLNHEDLMREVYATGVTRRTMTSLFATAQHLFDISRSKLIDVVTLNASLRYDNSITEPEKKLIRFPRPERRRNVRTESVSPLIGLTVTKGERIRLTGRASWGKSLRLPSINALFWQSDARSAGNPDLKPERSEQYEVGLEADCRLAWGTIAAGTIFYHKDISDMVVWIQSSPDGLFKPQNIGAAEVSGHEDYVRFNSFDDLLQFSYINSVTHARNRQTGYNYDKVITYTPAYVTTFRIGLNYRSLRVAYDIRRVGRRYALPGNEKWYDSYSLHDLAVSGQFTLNGNWHFELNGRIDNLTSEEYVLIGQHPMPGRSYNLGISIKYELKGNKK